MSLAHRFSWLLLLLVAVVSGCNRSSSEATGASSSAGSPQAAATGEEPLPQGSVSLRFLYTNNVDGDTEPCG